MDRRDFLRIGSMGSTMAIFPGAGISGCSRLNGSPVINTDYRDRSWGELFLPVETDIDSNGITRLAGDRAEIIGGPQAPWQFGYERGMDWIEGWTSPHGLSVSWTVNSPQDLKCSLALMYACPSESAGSRFEIIVETPGYVGYGHYGRSKIEGIEEEVNGTVGWLGMNKAGFMNFERRELDQTINLPAGKSTITIQAISMPETAQAVMTLRSLELIPETAKPALSEAKKRADQLRSNMDWFVDAQYGVMFHFSPTVYPRRGPRKPFDQAVREFDVDRFVEMVKQTGAGYVTFFVSHGIFWIPAPIQTVEDILPGRTCDRDLIGDVAHALSKEGIRLKLYYNPSYFDDVDWRIAAGWGPERYSLADKSPFYENQIRILEELGQRYGNYVSGYWFDNGFPHQLFEKQAHACKLGNPDRIIAYNTGIYPKVTDFQDYYAGEFGSSPILPPDDYFDEGGPQAGLQPHGTIFIDGAWHHFLPDTEIGPQRFTTESLIQYTKECIDRKLVLTINMCIYQDGSVSPVTLDQMKELRKAIRKT